VKGPHPERRNGADVAGMLGSVSEIETVGAGHGGRAYGESRAEIGTEGEWRRVGAQGRPASAVVMFSSNCA
jgi:hypothetical protein